AFVRDQDIDRVPVQYRHMVGPSGYIRALGRMVEAARPRGIPIVNFADYVGGARRIDGEALGRAQDALGIVRPRFSFPNGQKYQRSADDAHLNPLGNELVAQQMLEGLEATGVCLPSGG